MLAILNLLAMFVADLFKRGGSAALSVLKLQIYNNGDEVRRGPAPMRCGLMLDGAMDRSVFAKRPMSPQPVIISGILRRIRRRCASPKTTTWSTHSRRIDPINLSAKPFCQGEPGQWACRGCPWPVIGG